MRKFYVFITILAGIILDLTLGVFMDLLITVPFFSVFAFLITRNSFGAVLVLGFFWDSLGIAPFGTYLVTFFLAASAASYLKKRVSYRNLAAEIATWLFLFLLFFAVLPWVGWGIAASKGISAGWLKLFGASFIKTFSFQFLITALAVFAVSWLMSVKKHKGYV